MRIWPLKLLTKTWNGSLRQPMRGISCKQRHTTQKDHPNSLPIIDRSHKYRNIVFSQKYSYLRVIIAISFTLKQTKKYSIAYK